MSYPLIILGAGASHDYAKHCDIPPPITKELVARGYFNGDLLQKYPLTTGLLSEIESAVNTHGQGFEQALNNIKERSGHIAEIQAQLVALEFYLQDLFEKISDGFQEINHYKSLQQRIISDCGGKACVVSFNYDSLFEDSIVGQNWKKMDDYVRGDLKVIKLHGSHNWSYIGNKEAMHFSGDYKGGYEFLTDNVDFITALRLKGGIDPYHKKELTGGNFFRFPALAIPLLSKQDITICPKRHIDVLCKELQEVDRVLIIGWSASDNYLLGLIKKHAKRNIRFMLVSKEKISAGKITTKIAKATELIGESISGGFGRFVGSEKYFNFFSK